MIWLEWILTAALILLIGELEGGGASAVTVDEAPGIIRQERSQVDPGELVTLRPLQLTTPNPTRASFADQLFFDDPFPPISHRAVPTPPPPADTDLTSSSAAESPAATAGGATAGATSTTKGADALLNALLPFLAFTALGGYAGGGGSFASGEKGFMLPYLLSGQNSLSGLGGPLSVLGAFGGPFSSLSGLSGIGALGPLGALSGLGAFGNSFGGIGAFGGGPLSAPPFSFRNPLAENRAKPVGSSQPEKKNPGSNGAPVAAALKLCSSSPICADAPFDKILSIGDSILAVKGSRLYKIGQDGIPVSSSPANVDPALRDVTAAAMLRGSNYIFQGDRYHKFRNGAKGATSISKSQLVSEGFPGVPSPVDAVFQLNNSTFVIISGSQFVYYQPESNPPVDLRHSPRSLATILGAPPRVDSAFFVNKRTILNHRGVLYELEPGKMQIRRKVPVVSSKEDGWINCTQKDVLCSAHSDGAIHESGKLSNQNLNMNSNSP